MAPALPQRPTTVLLLRTPVPPKEGTDPYHDVWGSFCLPSFPMSALDSGAATPIAAPFPHLSMTSVPGTSQTPSALSRSASGSSADRAKVVPALAGMTVTGTGNDGEAGTSGATNSGAASKAESSSTLPRPEEVLLERLQQQSIKQAESANVRTTSPRIKSAELGLGRASSKPNVPPAPFVLTTHHTSSDPATGTEREWCVTSLPVIGGKTVNTDQLQTLLAEEEWGGVVATSNRAWDAWKETVQELGSTHTTPPKTCYPDTPFFLISSRSAAAFRQPLEHLPKAWVPKANKVYGAPPTKKAKPTSGETASAGEALGEYILGWLTRRRDATADGQADSPLLSKPLLLLQGDKSLPALPQFLAYHSIPFRTLEIYATCADQSLQSNLSRLSIVYESLEVDYNEGDANSARPDWVVFFSPSGVEFSREALEELNWFPLQKANAPPRYITLGNTTGAHLKERYGLEEGEMVGVASTADPQGVKEALMRLETGA